MMSKRISRAVLVQATGGLSQGLQIPQCVVDDRDPPGDRARNQRPSLFNAERTASSRASGENGFGRNGVEFGTP